METENENLQPGKRLASQLAASEIIQITKMLKQSNTFPSPCTFIYTHRRQHTQLFNSRDLDVNVEPVFNPKGQHTTLKLEQTKPAFVNDELTEDTALGYLKVLTALTKPNSNRQKDRPKSQRALRRLHQNKTKTHQATVSEAIASLSGTSYNLKQLSTELLVKYSQVRSIIQRNRNYQSHPEQGRNLKNKIDEKKLAFLESFLSKPDNGVATLLSLRSELLKKFPETANISLQSIHRMIKRIGFSRKRSSKYLFKSQSEGILDSRRETALTLLFHLKSGKKIISLDETGVNSHLVPIYIYSKKGKRICLKVPPRGTNQTVLAAIGINDFYGFRILKGGATASDFGAFLCDLLSKNPDVRNDLANHIFFMDNCSIHTANALRLFSKYLNIQFNAPYTPFLNPIEEIFSVWKYEIRKLNVDRLSNITKNIVKAAKFIARRHFRSAFYHSYTYYEKCIQLQPIE